MGKTHEMYERSDPLNVRVSCTCGWSRTFTRRQNALARASKVRAAWREHCREIDAEEAAEAKKTDPLAMIAADENIDPAFRAALRAIA